MNGFHVFTHAKHSSVECNSFRNSSLNNSVLYDPRLYDGISFRSTYNDFTNPNTRSSDPLGWLIRNNDLNPNAEAFYPRILKNTSYKSPQNFSLSQPTLNLL